MAEGCVGGFYARAFGVDDADCGRVASGDVDEAFRGVRWCCGASAGGMGGVAGF